MEIQSKVFVNPQEVTQYYNQHPDDFRRPSAVELDSIYIPFSSDMEAARAKAKEAYNAIQGGKSFSEVAKEYSSLPALGVVHQGQLLPNIDKAAFSLHIDEVSFPIESDKGIYILKLKTKLPEEIVPLEAAKSAINNRIRQTKFREKYKTYIDKLKKNAYIEVKE
jgi:parvulin-like peptidyl-prolyl isomerase